MDYNWSGKVILIAEDVDVNFRFLEKILQDTNAEIVRARNGQEAIDLVESRADISLILMDIQMPGIDGYAATQAIKKINKDLPIIAQTAHAIDGGRDKGIESGCDEYIVKPLNINKMYAAIDKHLR